jgi:SNF2 family DNA or RNA helicase
MQSLRQKCFLIIMRGVHVLSGRVKIFSGKLKPYQEQPVDSFCVRKSLLVAFEMGLGKTVIGIAAAERLMDSGAVKSCLIVCPASLKYQWRDRILQFTDHSAAVIDGVRNKRLPKYMEARNERYVIISYENTINDSEYVAKIKPDMVILDEATAIKTFRAKRTKQIKRMLKAEYRLALTGTPIENKPDELFSIMQWVDDTVLGRYDLFDKSYIRRNPYGWVAGYKNLHVLREKIAPAMSRKSRNDPDVSPYLPEAEFHDWITPVLADNARKLYRKICSDMLREMDNLSPETSFRVHDYYSGVSESTPAGKLMGMYSCLEMLLDHPDLIIISAKNGAVYANELWQEGWLDDITRSVKLDYLTSLVPDLLEFSETRILIYTQFRSVLDIIEDELGVNCVQFHGGLSASEKADVISRFTDDHECRVFLSSHAGAYGVDMHMANVLVNYDHPWSAGKADQVNGRHVRVSSEFDRVYVCNMITPGTIEEWKLRKQERKRSVASAVMDGYGADSEGRIPLDGDTLRDHLTWVVTTW